MDYIGFYYTVFIISKVFAFIDMEYNFYSLHSITYIFLFLILNDFCFQEVETDQFYNFFLPELKRDGYDGIFSPKSRARTMTESERKHVDGCAIFYRTAK